MNMIKMTDGKEAVVAFLDATLAQPDLCEAGRVWTIREAERSSSFAELFEKVLNSKNTWMMWWRDRLNDILSDEIKVALVEQVAKSPNAAALMLEQYSASLTDAEKALLKN